MKLYSHRCSRYHEGVPFMKNITTQTQFYRKRNNITQTEIIKMEPKDIKAALETQEMTSFLRLATIRCEKYLQQNETLGKCASMIWTGKLYADSMQGERG